jgi:hypothetical protein
MYCQQQQAHLHKRFVQTKPIQLQWRCNLKYRRYLFRYLIKLQTVATRLLHLTLNVLPTATGAFTQTICANETFTFNGVALIRSRYLFRYFTSR